MSSSPEPGQGGPPSRPSGVFPFAPSKSAIPKVPAPAAGEAPPPPPPVAADPYAIPAPYSVPALPAPEPRPIAQEWEPSLPVDTSAMPLRAIIAANVAAVAGGLAWALVIFAAKSEFGILAWGIGTGIGLAAQKFGGRGFNMGMLSVFFTVVAIFGGRFIGIAASYPDILYASEESMQVFYSEGDHADMLAAADEFVTLENDGEIRDFMVRRRYAFVEDSSEITDAELLEFKETWSSLLTKVHAAQPDHQTWRRMVSNHLIDELIARGEITVWTTYRETFGYLTFIFILLGIGTAFWRGGQKDGPT